METQRGSTLSFFWSLFRNHPVRSISMVMLMTLAGLGEGLGIVTLLPIIETALGSADEPSTISLLVIRGLQFLGFEASLPALLTLIVVAISLKAVAVWFAMNQVAFAVADQMKEWRIRLLKALLAARWEHFSKERTGSVASVVTHEANRAAAAYRESCGALAGLLQVLMYAVIAVWISWPVALMASVAGLGSFVVFRGLTSSARQAGMNHYAHVDSLTARLVDVLQGIKPIKAMAHEERLLPHLRRDAEGLAKAEKQLVFASETTKMFLEPIAAVLLALGIAGVLRWQLVPFATVLVLAFVFYRLLAQLNGLLTRYQVIIAGESAYWAMHRMISRVESQAETDRGSRQVDRVEEAIRLEDVSFAYSDHPVLQGVNLEIPAGSLCALSGASGQGKSTLADLILGLLRPTEGRITIDGIPLGEVDLRNWRSNLGYVPQEILLLNDSILENVTLGDPSLSREDADRALSAAGAADFVAGLPEGIETKVGERGSRLSGGQRQRIAIARALVRRPTLLILDEVTSALDPQTERDILSQLHELKGSVTMLFISHQSEVRRYADRIFVIKNRRVETALTPQGIRPAGPATIP